mgnify:FL=1
MAHRCDDCCEIKLDAELVYMLCEACSIQADHDLTALRAANFAAESKLAEARALLERIIGMGGADFLIALDDVEAWLAANPGTEAKR